MTNSASVFYVDTSAYLAILLGQNGGREIQREIRGARLVSSALMVLESTRNLVRLTRAGKITTTEYGRCITRLEADLAFFTIRDLTLDLCMGSTMPVVSLPRTLDLAHLRTALWFHAQSPLERFVTLDRDQREAATELGLPV